MRPISVASVFVIFCLFVTLCKSYSGIIPADPDNEGKCFYRGEEISKGISYGPGICRRLTCNDDGSILVEGCGKITLPDCRNGERKDITKPYPECCEMIFKCKHENGTKYTKEYSTYNNTNLK